MSRSLHPLDRIFRSLNKVQSLSSPDGLNNTLLSQGCTTEMAPSMGTVGQMYIPSTGDGVRKL